MKNLLLILALVAGLSAAAQPSIIHVSYNDSTPIALGSSQYVELQADTSTGLNIDSMRVYLAHYVDSTNSLSNTIVIYAARPADYYQLAVDTFYPPVGNPEAVRRVNFTMPSNYPSGVFLTYSNPANALFGRRGIVYNPTGIAPIRESADILSYRYYNFSGQEVDSPAGLCIREAVYRDGYLSRQKVYLQ